MKGVGKASWLVSLTLCLIGFASGYEVKARLDKRESVTSLVHRNWNIAARRRWPGLLSWSDAQITAMLGSAATFRSAFQECGNLDDGDIDRIAANDPGDNFEFYTPCVQGAPGKIVFDMSTAQPIPGVESGPPPVPADWKKQVFGFNGSAR